MKTTRSFAGANVYSQRPAVVLNLDFGDLNDKKSNQAADFNSRLLDFLPALGERFCGSDDASVFAERLERGTHFNHVVEHVAVELMRLAGVEARVGICERGENVSKAIIETTAQETARCLLPFAAELVEAIADGKTPRTEEVEEKIIEAKRVAASEELDANSKIIVRAAERRGIPWTVQNERDSIQLGYGANLRLIQSATTDGTSLIGSKTARDANLTRQRLRRFSIAAPVGRAVGEESAAVEAFEEIGAPIVVKPLDKNRGIGVSLDLNSREEVVEAFRVARKYSARVLIEEQLEGKNYRVLVIGGKMIAAIERTADGAIGDRTGETHETVVNLCERAARIVNLDICEINLITTDISARLPEKKAGIVEINVAPDLRKYVFSNDSESPDVGGAVVEMLYPNRQNGRVPIVSVTGTNGKTSVTRMIAHILRAAGFFVGMTTTGGIYLDGEPVARGDMTGPNSAKTILGDRAVEIAVLETARGGILKRGLGYDWSDVAVLTNISEDHIGQDGIESIADLIGIKALIAERLRAGGTLVVNADDENSLTVLEREAVKSIPKKIVYFSLAADNPQVLGHLEQGGTAYFQKDGFVVEGVGRENFPIVEVGEIAATLGGTAEFQTANAMAAIAACRAVEVSPEHCASALATFRSDADNPGRNNLYRVGAGYVLVDYGHNTDGFAAVSRMARRWTGKTVTGIIGLPGDRENRIVEEAARAAARGFDRVIVTEEVNRRGREVGEMAKLLRDAIKREKPDTDCEIVLDEIAAFSKALAEMRENEVVVIFYRQFDLILEVLARNGAVPVSSFADNDGEK